MRTAANQQKDTTNIYKRNNMTLANEMSQATWKSQATWNRRWYYILILRFYMSKIFAGDNSYLKLSEWWKFPTSSDLQLHRRVQPSTIIWLYLSDMDIESFFQIHSVNVDYFKANKTKNENILFISREWKSNINLIFSGNKTCDIPLKTRLMTWT